MEQLIENDIIKHNKNYTAAHKKAQYKYNAQHKNRINKNKLILYHKKKNETEYKALIRINNKISYQKRKGRLIKEAEEKLNHQLIIEVNE